MLVAGARMGRASAEQQQQQQQQAYQQGQQQAQKQQQAQAPPTPTAAPAAPQKDPIAELQKLSDLHNSGVLTDEEFAAAKKKLLS